MRCGVPHSSFDNSMLIDDLYVVVYRYMCVLSYCYLIHAFIWFMFSKYCLLGIRYVQLGCIICISAWYFIGMFLCGRKWKSIFRSEGNPGISCSSTLHGWYECSIPKWPRGKLHEATMSCRASNCDPLRVVEDTSGRESQLLGLHDMRSLSALPALL